LRVQNYSKFDSIEYAIYRNEEQRFKIKLEFRQEIPRQYTSQ
jgi:hypothetical protein